MKALKLYFSTWSFLWRFVLILAITSISCYLTWAHYAQAAVLCPANVLHVPISCSLVLKSSYDVILGLPVSLWGGLWALSYFLTKRDRGVVWPLWIIVGAAGIAWAIGHEITLHAICMWCTLMQVSIITMIGGDLVQYVGNIRGNLKHLIPSTRTSISIFIPLLLIGNLAGGILPSIIRNVVLVSSQNAIFDGLDNRTVELPQGPVVIEVMAPWCAYCATEARFVLSGAAQEAQAQATSFIIVDASNLGGVAQAADEPTLQSIENTASDGSRVQLSTNQEIAANLSQFSETYPVDSPFLFLPLGEQLPQNWKVDDIPEMLFLDSNHQLVSTLAGFNNLNDVKLWIDQEISKISNGKMNQTPLLAPNTFGEITKSKETVVEQTNSSDTPVITSVTPVINEGNPVIVIQGSGFGNTFPQSYIGVKTDTGFLKVTLAFWNAGYQNDFPLPDQCNATIATWTDSQIIVQLQIGGDSSLGSVLCPLITGTNLQVTIWNTSNGNESPVFSPVPVVTSLTNPPVVSGVSPDYGGGQVTITGSGFTGAQVVWFGTYPTTSINVISDTEITVNPPSDLKAEGVAVQVTVPSSGTNADQCLIIQSGCPDAYFYMVSTSISYIRNINISNSTEVGNSQINVSGGLDVSINLTSQLSTDFSIPSAWVINGTFLVLSSNLTIAVSGGLSNDVKVPLPLPGLPEGLALYARIEPEVTGSFSQSFITTGLEFPFSGGFVNGQIINPTVQVTCNGNPLSMSNLGQCLTTPASAEMDASVQFFPLWLQFGPDLSSVLGDTALDVGVGPGIGLGFEAPYNGQPVWDICAAVTAEAEVKIPNPTDPTNEDADLLNDTLSSALLGPYSIISSNNDDAVNFAHSRLRHQTHFPPSWCTDQCDCDAWQRAGYRDLESAPDKRRG